jgi:hypothetical protein
MRLRPIRWSTAKNPLPQRRELSVVVADVALMEALQAA